MCARGVIHSIGNSQDIRFMGGLTVYIPFTSSSLIVSDFVLCGMPFLAEFYSRDFIFEMFSMGYVNTFGFFLLFVSTGLTVCYSFRWFYFVWNERQFIPPCIPDSRPHRITNTKCRMNTVVSPDDGHIVARNMQRSINILRINILGRNCAHGWLYL